MLCDGQRVFCQPWDDRGPLPAQHEDQGTVCEEEGGLTVHWDTGEADPVTGAGFSSEWRYRVFPVSPAEHRLPCSGPDAELYPCDLCGHLVPGCVDSSCPRHRGRRVKGKLVCESCCRRVLRDHAV